MKYVVMYYYDDREYSIIPREIESKSNINNLEYSRFEDGCVPSKFVHDKLKDAVGQCNKMNLLIKKNKERDIFYNGRIVWINDKNYGLTRCMMTDIDYSKIIPVTTILPMHETALYRNDHAYKMVVPVTEIGRQFYLYKGETNV